MKILVTVKGGPGSGNWGHAGRPGLRGGSAKSAGDVGAYGNAPVPRPPREEFRRFMRGEGNVEIYHVTYSDRIESILDVGLVPAGAAEAAQHWEATHSGYATYFFADRSSAVRTAKGMVALVESKDDVSIIRAAIPRTEDFALRIIPDEDVSTNPNAGLRALRGKESVAVIAGVEPEYLSVDTDW